MRHPVLLIALSTALALPVPASAATVRLPHAPMLLPGDAGASAVRTVAGRWIVAAPHASAGAARIASRFSARPIGRHGAYSVDAGRARAFAQALERAGLLDYAQPNTVAGSTRSVGQDPYSQYAGWRDYVADPSIDPPAVGPSSPLIAVVDTAIDTGHPEFQGANLSVAEQAPVIAEHGTAVAATATAPVNGVGIVGIWPSARVVGVPLPGESFSCAQITEAVSKAVELKPAVINMSYGGEGTCFPAYVENQFAVAQGSIPVAAVGNEFNEGNPLEFPATYPHTLTVAAIGPDGQSSLFSNASGAVDVSAPGEGIVTAVPTQFDTDGTVDGYTSLDGTSFATPMASAATAWLRAARPDLRPDQVFDLVRYSAIDLNPPGYDTLTGFGLINVARALAAKKPYGNPNEPDDDVEWVNGRRFRKADTPLSKGSGTHSRLGSVDAYEDPADVYRVIFPARRSLRITLTSLGGDPDLYVYDRSSTTIDTRSTRHLIDRSIRSGERTDSVTIRNSSRRSISAFVVVKSLIPNGADFAAADYKITVKRR